MSDLMLDVDQAGELKAAFRRANYTNADIKRLSEGNILAGVYDVLRGFSAITPILHAINCDAAPYIPDSWSYREEDQLPNRARGIFTWDPTTVKLYLSKHQKGEKCIIGNELRKELAKQPVLNANVLDYLLKPVHRALIPEEWNGKYVFFWGTIYRNSSGSLYVRYLHWSGDKWYWSTYWLGDYFNSYDPAVVLAS